MFLLLLWVAPQGPTGINLGQNGQEKRSKCCFSAELSWWGTLQRQKGQAPGMRLLGSAEEGVGAGVGPSH